MKSGGWQLQKLSSTRYSEIVFYVLTVVIIVCIICLRTHKQGCALPTRHARLSPSNSSVPTARIYVYAKGY